MNFSTRHSLCVLLCLILAAPFAGCNRAKEEQGQPSVQGTREPRTSFGKAVDSAKRVSGRADDRLSELDREAASAGED